MITYGPHPQNIPPVHKQLTDGYGTIILRAEIVTSHNGMPLHSNINFGGRFGHSGIYHSMMETASQVRRRVLERFDGQSAFMRRYNQADKIAYVIIESANDE